MRVCMMNDTFYRSGGVPIVIKRLSQAFADVDVSVASCKYDGRPEDLSWISGDRFERFDLTSSNNPVQLVKELRRFKEWFKRQGCQLVHCHHRKLSVLMRLAGIPVVYTGHLPFPSVIWFKYGHPRHMTAVSESVAANLFEVTGQKSLACINNPVVFPKAPPRIDTARVGRRAVCIARLEPIKGHTHLLAAWKRLLDRGHRYELDLVGEGSLRPELEAQVKRDGLEGLVHFCGFKSDVTAVMGEALFAILASEKEGQCLVTLEAAAMGRASLLTAVPGSIDALPPGRGLKNGIQFGNAAELADAIEEWFANPESVVEEGRRFFDFQKALSDPNRIASQYLEVYQRVLLECA